MKRGRARLYESTTFGYSQASPWQISSAPHHEMSPAAAGVGGEDPPHPVDAAVDLGEGDPLVGAVDPLRVVRRQLEGRQAIRGDSPLAEETRVGEAGDDGGDDRP